VKVPPQDALVCSAQELNERTLSLVAEPSPSKDFRTVSRRTQFNAIARSTE
jgi:hypothetical protein